jgi:hypothetical protein
VLACGVVSEAQSKIDGYIAARPAWQAALLRQFREAVRATGVAEEAWKWDVPVFTKSGKNACSMAAFKEHVKFNFLDGAALDDSDGLFNNGLEAKKSRSIDVREGESVAAASLQRLVDAAFGVTG